MTTNESVSVIVPFTERVGDVATLLKSYRQGLTELGVTFEFICVLDGKFVHLEPQIRKLAKSIGPLKIIKFSRVYGESVALATAIEAANHDLILTLPSYEQVAGDKLSALFDSIEGADIVVSRRWPRKDSRINQFSNRVFHAVLRWVTQVPYRDLGCGVRLFRKDIFNEIGVYGDQFRFIPVLADRRGFRVREVDLPQSDLDLGMRLYGPRVYVSRILDLLGVFFLARFTKKPLRFFGMIGSVMGAAGVLVLTIIVFQRFFFGTALANRPVLLLGSLLLVVGAQLFALGLVGELIIFTHARDQKEYAIAETVNVEGDD